VIVSAGLIERDDGSLLIARRPPWARMGGYWEFPGGKLEDGETPEACLEREIREELGVEAEAGRIFHVKLHTDADLRVLLLFYRCRYVAGDPAAPARGGLEIAWVRPGELARFAFLPADEDVIRLLAAGG
jgi:mutator protein MutT